MNHKAKSGSYTGVPTMEPQMSYPLAQVGPLQANHMFVRADGVPTPHFSDPTSKKKNKNKKKRRCCLFFCCSNIELGDEDHKDKILQCLERATGSDHPKCLYMCCTNVGLAPDADQDGHTMMKGSGTKL